MYAGNIAFWLIEGLPSAIMINTAQPLGLTYCKYLNQSPIKNEGIVAPDENNKK
jgi:hypothetical protein